MEEHQYEQGPTGAILRDLPSPYEAHPCGLLHLPRFLAKIRKHLAGELPKSYQRNFTKGFDGFLCLHLGIEPQEVIDIVRDGLSEKDICLRFEELLPNDLQAHKWNRKVVQMGMSSIAKEKLEEVKVDMGAADRKDLISFADVIEYDEGRID
ncbi:MAG: DUF5069 domain-containing protein [Verrucomicrobia bacterium]|jgi:hypothetical protein|nr:DUF5069 domain-containing protein [Verrucomicrobiota bacterium]MDA1045471.1 DUF5069 domain-containing protein [Verrucomicrobiota bacterium]|tara:strand:- start:234 stop:689 length:456 start_codon:yes stop_codon:yes gene_type:complete